MLLIAEGPKKVKIREKKGLFGPTEIREEKYVIAKKPPQDDYYKSASYRIWRTLTNVTDIDGIHADMTITHTNGIYQYTSMKKRRDQNTSHLRRAQME